MGTHTFQKTALTQHDTDIKADVGDFSGQTHLQTLLASLGIPDTDSKPLYTVLITDLLSHATHGLAQLQADIAAIPITMVGTDGAALASSWTAALATALANYTAARAGYLDNIDTKAMGRLQIATTTWDLLRGGGGAGTDILFTGTTQAVVLVSLVARMPTLADVTDGDPITSMAIATDDAEPGIIIPSGDAPVASMTPEAQFAWTGALYIPVGTEIEGTIAGGDADAECLVIVTALYRAVVAGGYLA